MDATGTRPWRVRTSPGHTRKRSHDALARVHTPGDVLRMTLETVTLSTGDRACVFIDGYTAQQLKPPPGSL